MTPIDIRKIRGKNTRKDFADLLGITESYVYMLETGLRTPSKSLMLLLLKVKNEQKKGELK